MTIILFKMFKIDMPSSRHALITTCCFHQYWAARRVAVVCHRLYCSGRFLTRPVRMASIASSRKVLWLCPPNSVSATIVPTPSAIIWSLSLMDCVLPPPDPTRVGFTCCGMMMTTTRTRRVMEKYVIWLNTLRRRWTGVKENVALLPVRAGLMFSREVSACCWIKRNRGSCGDCYHFHEDNLLGWAYCLWTPIHVARPDTATLSNNNIYVQAGPGQENR